MFFFISSFSDFTDASAFWMFPYETVNMRQEIEEVWEQVKRYFY